MVYHVNNVEGRESRMRVRLRLKIPVKMFSSSAVCSEACKATD